MTVSPFSDLPLTDRSRRWNGGTAEKRVRAWAGAKDGPNARYRKAHLWYDADNKDNFTGYKLHVPDSDLPRLRRHLTRYYTKMGKSPPWR